MRLTITHATAYSYLHPVSDSLTEVRLKPTSDHNQKCLSFHLRVSPVTKVFEYTLPAGDVHHFQIRASHTRLLIQADSEVQTCLYEPFASLDLVNHDDWFYRQEGVRDRYIEYLQPTPMIPLPEALECMSEPATHASGQCTAKFLLHLNKLIYQRMRYQPGSTDAATSIIQPLETGAGVCQDFAQIMIGVCRRHGIPARYVSGYLFSGHDHGVEERKLPSLENELSGERRYGYEAKDTLRGAHAMHAWVECLMPNGAWCGFDPTNNLVTNQHFVKVYTGRDYKDAAPFRGIYRGARDHEMDYQVTIAEFSNSLGH